MLVLGQDELEAFTSKTPMELMSIFEKISGSEKFKKPYDEIANELKQLNKAIVEKGDRINFLRKTTQKTKALICNGEDLNKLYKQKDDLKVLIFELTFLKFNRIVLQKKMQIRDLDADVEQLSKQINQVTIEIAEINTIDKKLKKNDEMRQLKNEKNEYEKQIEIESKTVRNLETRLVEVERSIKSTNEKIENQIELKKSKKDEKNALETTIEELVGKMKNLEKFKSSAYDISKFNLKDFENFTNQLNVFELELFNL